MYLNTVLDSLDKDSCNKINRSFKDVKVVGDNVILTIPRELFTRRIDMQSEFAVIES